MGQKLKMSLRGKLCSDYGDFQGPGDFALEVKQEPMMLFAEENEMRDRCFRAVTFRFQLQGQG